jgi:hypothetical protein
VTDTRKSDRDAGGSGGRTGRFEMGDSWDRYAGRSAGDTGGSREGTGRF